MFTITINNYMIAGNQYGSILIDRFDKTNIKYFGSFDEAIRWAANDTEKK